jgi:outer membrane protein OmpA-like peptidoglycan-associated protein
MMLAKKRAASAVQYLVSKGIDSKRLSATSNGESMPVALNENPDGSDRPDGRKLNRRVEFRVIRPDLPNVKTEAIQVPANLKK